MVWVFRLDERCLILMSTIIKYIISQVSQLVVMLVLLEFVGVAVWFASWSSQPSAQVELNIFVYLNKYVYLFFSRRAFLQKELICQWVCACEKADPAVVWEFGLAVVSRELLYVCTFILLPLLTDHHWAWELMKLFSLAHSFFFFIYNGNRPVGLYWFLYVYVKRGLDIIKKRRCQVVQECASSKPGAARVKRDLASLVGSPSFVASHSRSYLQLYCVCPSGYTSSLFYFYLSRNPPSVCSFTSCSFAKRILKNLIAHWELHCAALNMLHFINWNDNSFWATQMIYFFLASNFILVELFSHSYYKNCDELMCLQENFHLLSNFILINLFSYQSRMYSDGVAVALAGLVAGTVLEENFNCRNFDFYLEHILVRIFLKKTNQKMIYISSEKLTWDFYHVHTGDLTQWSDWEGIVGIPALLDEHVKFIDPLFQLYFLSFSFSLDSVTKNQLLILTPQLSSFPILACSYLVRNDRTPLQFSLFSKQILFPIVSSLSSCLPLSSAVYNFYLIIFVHFFLTLNIPWISTSIPFPLVQNCPKEPSPKFLEVLLFVELTSGSVNLSLLMILKEKMRGSIEQCLDKHLCTLIPRRKMPNNYSLTPHSFNSHFLTPTSYTLSSKPSTTNLSDLQFSISTISQQSLTHSHQLSAHQLLQLLNFTASIYLVRICSGHPENNISWFSFYSKLILLSSSLSSYSYYLNCRGNFFFFFFSFPFFFCFCFFFLS
ncbi:hypothetical protein VP01_1237g3 [Puccinia sorghi]|uniref:Uncharacterized protein n=1 Tax=Puccinia sorghi TaxID=27349 RepID=A0A0L6VPP1_9BASI|nr:hypothetical protein VP01_1237g3 [Puccinia sorghi]